MNTVECPRCGLHFEPDEESSATRDDIFCPQCGLGFYVESKTPQNAESAAV